MSIKQQSLIEPQDFINLKNQVQAEVKRRNYKDLNKLYNLYSSNSYNFNITPTKNKEISYEDIRTILTPLEAINKDTLDVNIQKEQTNISYSDFNKIQNALNIFSKGERRNNNTCSASCIGMCIGCTDSCTSCTGCTSCQGCTDCTGCTGSCNGCTGGCEGSQFACGDPASYFAGFPPV